MAYIFRKNASIPFSHTFYDSTGGKLSPGSATCWVTYSPQWGSNSPGYSPSGLSGGSFPYASPARETTHFTLTQDTTDLAFKGSWSSTGAGAGMVYWHIRSTASTLDVAEGAFELRSNPAGGAST